MHKRRQPRHRKPSNYSVASRRVAARATTVMAGTAVAGTVLAPSASAEGPLRPPLVGKKADRLGDYVPQRLCDPSAKPGTLAFANLVLSHYRTGYSGGIGRACGIGGTSEHKEGRAWDWMINANDPRQRAVAEDFIDWLTRRDGPKEQRGYNARRLGVMYVIWNREIWGAYRADQGWRDYDGTNPHTDHIHISLTWAGAMQRTSWWAGTTNGARRQKAPDSLAVAATSSTGSASRSRRYNVVRGDTLSELAARFRTTVGEIQDANGLSGDLILVGQVLAIPG